MIFAGTDLDGDRILERTENYAAFGNTGVPITITISDSNVNMGSFILDGSGFGADMTVNVPDFSRFKLETDSKYNFPIV